MRKITVHLKNRSYPIVIGRRLLPSLGHLLKPLGLGRKILIVSNRKVARRFLAPVSKTLVQSGFQAFSYLLPHGDERDKSERELSRLWTRMAQIPLDRTSSILALGGGVVGDIAGFSASTYMRGISLIQVPTTLLAQVDSAIGGKTAIDLPSGKNIVGTFYQPRIVVSDVEVLRTLPPKEFQNSFAEVIKYGVIRDLELFELLEQKTSRFLASLRKRSLGLRELSFLETIVWRSARVKAGVVEHDERETKGERMILNYGHTFAHGIEAASGFKMPHGEAVATGMVLAGELALRVGIFDGGAQNRQIDLIERTGLPTRINGRRFTSAKILSFMRRDKKAHDGRLKFVLPKKIGQVGLYDHISEKLVRKTLDQNRSRQ